MTVFCVYSQLFEIFESLPNASLDKMNSVVRSAINMCTAVYLAMGVFGYIAYCTQPFTGKYKIFQSKLISGNNIFEKLENNPSHATKYVHSLFYVYVITISKFLSVGLIGMKNIFCI